MNQSINPSINPSIHSIEMLVYVRELSAGYLDGAARRCTVTTQSNEFANESDSDSDSDSDSASESESESASQYNNNNRCR